MNSGKIVAGRDGKIEGPTRGPRGPKKGLRGQRLPGTVLLQTKLLPKTLADLPLVHSCIIFLCCLDGPSDNDKDHVVGLLTNLPPPPHPC